MQLEVRGLCAFYGRAQALDGVDMAVDRGEAVALLGRNGAGKSTILKSLMGLSARRGAVTFDGTRTDRLRPFEICRLGLGYVPEERRIFTNLTVAENLAVGRRDGTGGRWPLERVLDVFPNLAPLLHKPAGHMSGGEQQMLNFARTLMGAPQMMLVDEPSEGLAPVIVERMAAMIHALKADGTTLLVSEQNLAFAADFCERAYIVERGQIRFGGAMRTILDDPALKASYLAV